MTIIKDKVDELFRSVLAEPEGQVCDNPITGGRFVKGEHRDDSIAYQKREAAKALLAQEWFALYGPSDAPPLPVTQHGWEEMRRGTGLETLVGFYARSLSFRDWRVHDHPSFDAFACGLLDLPDTGFWDVHGRVARKPGLLKRYPARALIGMTIGAYWAPPLEWKEIMAEYQRASRRRGIVQDQRTA